MIIEDYIAEKLKDLGDINQNHTWGVDIQLNIKLRTIYIEVKSANRYVKNGKKGWRAGAFYFYPYNLNRADFYALVINYYDKPKTFWIEKKEIQKYFKNHKKRNKLCLTIPSLLNGIKKIDFSEMIK